MAVAYCVAVWFRHQLLPHVPGVRCFVVFGFKLRCDICGAVDLGQRAPTRLFAFIQYPNGRQLRHDF